ncbi:MAG: hypothetical protein OEW58_12645 [Gammaproteobacteria bacterium]|nr:hypothetical protein [Gammaproteobacteria bacterium]
MTRKSGITSTSETNLILKLIESISSWRLRTTISIIFLLSSSSILISYVTKDANWFSASGGIVTIIGVLILSGVTTHTKFEDIGEEINHRLGFNNKGLPKNGNEFMSNVVTITNEVLHIRQKQIEAAWYVAVGTFIWAYGFLLGKISWFSATNCT